MGPQLIVRLENAMTLVYLGSSRHSHPSDKVIFRVNMPRCEITVIAVMNMHGGFRNDNANVSKRRVALLTMPYLITGAMLMIQTGGHEKHAP